MAGRRGREVKGDGEVERSRGRGRTDYDTGLL